MATSAAVEIRLNGKSAEFPGGMTLAALLASLGKNPLVVAIERNGEIVPRARFGSVAVEHGDAVEIVQFVQGG